MAKIRARAVVVALAVMLVAGCGGVYTSNSEPPSSTTETKTVATSYCGDWAEAAREGLLSPEEITRITSDAMFTGDFPGVIILVWTDGSISPTKAPCTFIDGPSPAEQGKRFRTYEEWLQEQN